MYEIELHNFYIWYFDFKTEKWNDDWYADAGSAHTHLCCYPHTKLEYDNVNHAYVRVTEGAI